MTPAPFKAPHTLAAPPVVEQLVAPHDAAEGTLDADEPKGEGPRAAGRGKQRGKRLSGRARQEQAKLARRRDEQGE